MNGYAKAIYVKITNLFFPVKVFIFSFLLLIFDCSIVYFKSGLFLLVTKFGWFEEKSRKIFTCPKDNDKLAIFTEECT